jgi:cell wall-associated NlpC family hydrolase
MKKLSALLLISLLSISAVAHAQSKTELATEPDFLSQMKAVITKHLGRPYVWGGAGLKNFDCSGFVWRVLFENGILTKRTTARKFYMLLPKVDPSEASKFGTIVFFDNLKHMGIVDSQKTFYHAQVSRGTNLSNFDPFWRPKVTGFRGIPQKSP